MPRKPLTPPPPPPQSLIKDSIPLLGGLTVRMLPPSIIIGPIIGIAATFVRQQGGLAATKSIPWVAHSLAVTREWDEERFNVMHKMASFKVCTI